MFNDLHTCRRGDLTQTSTTSHIVTSEHGYLPTHWSRFTEIGCCDALRSLHCDWTVLKGGALQDTRADAFQAPFLAMAIRSF